MSKSDKVTDVEKYTVSRGDVVKTVTGTGQIRSKSSAVLRFKVAGIVDSLMVDVGDIVNKGQVLARLDNQDLQKKLVASEAEVNTAKVAVFNAEAEIEDTLIKNKQDANDLYVDAPVSLLEILNNVRKVHATLSSFYDSNNKLLSSIKSSIPNQQYIINADNLKPEADTALSKINGYLGSYSSVIDPEKLDSDLKEVTIPLARMQSAVSLLNLTTQEIKTGLTVSADTLEGYKSSLTTAQSNMNLALTSEVELRRDLGNILVNNQLKLNSAEADLRVKMANLETAQASYAVSLQNFRDLVIYSPINGVVATRSKEIGELVNTSDQVYFIIGSGDKEVVANIPEIDIGQIKVGDLVYATLDALDIGEVFLAEVTSIDPDQTTIDGVVYYKTRIEFQSLDERFKSGMSVNLDIVVNHKKDVLAVPRRAVQRVNGVEVVKVYQGEEIVEKEVEVGLRGDKMIEIISGLSEGELLVIGV